MRTHYPVSTKKLISWPNAYIVKIHLERISTGIFRRPLRCRSVSPKSAWETQHSYINVISDSIEITHSQIDVSLFLWFSHWNETHGFNALEWPRHFVLAREGSNQVDLPVLWQGTSILTITWGHAELSRTIHGSHLQSDLCLSVLLLPPTKQRDTWSTWNDIYFHLCNHSNKIYIEEKINIIYTVRFILISPHQHVARLTSFQVTNNYT